MKYLYTRRARPNEWDLCIVSHTHAHTGTRAHSLFWPRTFTRPPVMTIRVNKNGARRKTRRERFNTHETRRTRRPGWVYDRIGKGPHPGGDHLKSVNTSRRFNTRCSRIGFTTPSTFFRIRMNCPGQIIFPKFRHRGNVACKNPLARLRPPHNDDDEITDFSPANPSSFVDHVSLTSRISIDSKPRSKTPILLITAAHVRRYSCTDPDLRVPQ